MKIGSFGPFENSKQAVKFFVIVCISVHSVICEDLIVNREVCEPVPCGTQYVEQGEYPFLVALLFESRLECAGTLVSTSQTLTACHCLVKDKLKPIIEIPHRLIEPKSVQVLAGTVNLRCPNQRCSTRRAYQLQVHPKCARNSSLTQFDFGLILVEKPFVIWPFHIIAINLADFRQTDVISMLNGYPAPCVLMGWRLRTERSLENSLRKINVTLQNSLWCEESLLNVTMENQLQPIKFDSRFSLCASGKEFNSTVCEGDIGGPLLCRSENDNEFIALVSGREKVLPCGKNIPLIFARLDIAAKWITNVTPFSGAQSKKLHVSMVNIILATYAVMEFLCRR